MGLGDVADLFSRFIEYQKNKQGALPDPGHTPFSGLFGLPDAAPEEGVEENKVLAKMAQKYALPVVTPEQLTALRAAASAALAETKGDVDKAAEILGERAAKALGLPLLSESGFDIFGRNKTAAGGISDEDLKAAMLAAENRKSTARSQYLAFNDLLSMGLSPAQAEQAMLKQFGLLPPGESASASTNAAANMIQALAQQAHQQDVQRRGEFEAQYAPLNFGINAQNAATSQGNALTAGYEALARNNYQTGVLQGNAGTLFGNLAQSYGGLAEQQQRLGLDLLGNPRNAIPALLMAAGQEGRTGFENFDVRRILGIDPNQITNLFNQAIEAAQQQLATARQTPQFDLLGQIQALQAAAAAAAAKAPRLAPASAPDAGAGAVNRPPRQEVPQASTPAGTAPVSTGPTLLDALAAAMNVGSPAGVEQLYGGIPLNQGYGNPFETPYG